MIFLLLNGLSEFSSWADVVRKSESVKFLVTGFLCFQLAVLENFSKDRKELSVFTLDRFEKK